MPTENTQEPARKNEADRQNVVAHTIITLCVLSFAGTGCLQGKINPWAFICLSAVALGWVPAAVFVNFGLRLLDGYLRALYTPVPGSLATPGTPTATPREHSNSILPPPGLTGLMVTAAGLSSAFRMIPHDTMRHATEFMATTSLFIPFFVFGIAALGGN